MKYAAARPKIRSGDLLAWSHREPWYKSWYDFKIAMVRMFTMSEYSHVATAWVVGGRVFVIEAVVPLVRIYPLSKLGEFYWVPLNVEFSEDTLDFALENVGEKYSQLQAMEAFFRLPREDNLWECAELARAIAAKCGVNLGQIATPSAVIDNALRNGSECILVIR